MRLRYRTREALTGYGFSALWIAGFLVFTLIPLFRTIWLSLNTVKITTKGIQTTYVGIKNYKDAFLVDVKFVDILTEYLIQLIVLVPVIIVFSLIAAMLLNTKVRGRSLFRTIFFLPVIITSGPVIKKLTDEGATTFPGLEQYIASSRLEETFPSFLARLISFLVSSFIIVLWFSGVQILIFLAGLQKLDKSMYESASIDGASQWEAFWKLTLPSMNSLIMVNIVYTIITYSTFALNPVIELIVNSIYDGLKGYGYSSAIAWIYFIALLVVLGIFTFIVKHRDKTGAN